MRQLKSKNIGASHPLYNHHINDSHTQVIIYDQADEDRIIAHFFGWQAKLDAAQFITMEKLVR